MLDTHCHLFYPNYENDIDSVIENAIKVGIKSIIVPGTDLTTSKQAIELANNYDIVYAAVGVHPEDAKDWNSESINELREMATYLPLADFLVKRSPAVLKSNAKATVRSEDSAL